MTFIFGILTSLVAVWVTVFLYGRFNPVIDLRIKPVWNSSKNIKVMKLIIEIENLGFLRVEVKRILLSVIEHQLPILNKCGQCIGTEWVEFNEADQILTSTTWINPKEVLHVERLYQLGQTGILHVGLQIHLSYPWFIDRLGPRVRTRRQTRTFYISPMFDEVSSASLYTPT